MFRRVLQRLLYGGTSAFSPDEWQLVDSLIEVLPPEDASHLQNQVDNISLIQRSNQRRMVLVFFDEGISPRLSNTSEQNCLAVIEFNNALGRNSCSVFTHRGLLSSMEFDKPMPARASSTVEIVRIVMQPVEYKSIAENIDNEEHEDLA